MIIVSLTSFGERLQIEAPIAINSILHNNILPDKICLTVNSGDIVPEELLHNNLIEIIYSDLDIKGHNKYYHTMLKYPDAVIITIDDDIEYPIDFIEKCVDAYKDFPNVVNACRVHKIKMTNDHLMPYNMWEWNCKNEEPSYRLFFTSGAGTVFPPNIFSAFDLEDIEKTLYADDVYLNNLCRINKIKVRRIPGNHFYRDIKMLPNKFQLCSINLNGNNDDCLQKIRFEQTLQKVWFE